MEGTGGEWRGGEGRAGQGRAGGKLHGSNHLVYDYVGQQCPNSMFINPVGEDEVVNIIKSCKPKHSKDCDDINMYVISKVTDQIVHNEPPATEHWYNVCVNRRVRGKHTTHVASVRSTQ